MENPKPDPQNRPEAGLFRGRYSGRDSLWGGGLERAKGFEPSTPTLATSITREKEISRVLSQAGSNQPTWVNDRLAALLGSASGGSTVGLHSRTRRSPCSWAQRYHRGYRNRRWRPSGDGPGALPRFLVVGDAGEPATQFDRSRKFTILLIDSADRGGIGFGDNEHGSESGPAGRRREEPYESLPDFRQLTKPTG